MLGQEITYEPFAEIKRFFIGTLMNHGEVIREFQFMRVGPCDRNMIAARSQPDNTESIQIKELSVQKPQPLSGQEHRGRSLLMRLFYHVWLGIL